MRKTLSVFLAVVMLISTCLPVGAIQLEAVESAAEITTAIPEAVDAELQSTVQPGFNVYTGTEGVWDFENGTIPAAILEAGSSASVHTFDVEGSPKWMKFTTGTEEGSGQAFYFHYGVVMEAGRQYYYTYEARSSHAVTTYLFRQNNADLASHYGLVNGASDATLGGLYKGKVANTVTGNGGDSSNFFYIQQSGSGVFDFYIDDIAFIPYYKMTFHNADGSVLEEKQVLLDANGNILEYYNTNGAATEPAVPADAEGKVFIGWADFNYKSEEEGALSYDEAAEYFVETQGVYELYHEDMDFYPVFGTEDQKPARIPQAGDPGTNLLTGTTSAVTFDSESDVEKFTYLAGTANPNGGWSATNESAFTPVYDAENGRVVLDVTADAARLTSYRMNMPMVAAKDNTRQYYVNADVTAATDNSYWAITFDGTVGWPSRGDSMGLGMPKHASPWGAMRRTLPVTSLVSGSTYSFTLSQYDSASTTWRATVDNLAVVPYYKVNYYKADGSEILETRQVLFEDESAKSLETILTSYTPDTTLSVEATEEGYAFAGWSTKQNATAPMETVKLENLDINLYPVFVDVSNVFYNISATTARGGSVEGAGEYNATATVTLVATPAEGYNFVGWYNGDTQVSTSATYTFKATQDIVLVAKFQAANYKEGTIGKPGINLYTGTNQVQDFQDYPLGSEYTNDPNTAGNETFIDNNGNKGTIVDVDGNKYIKFEGAANYYMKLWHPTNSYEVDRKHYFTFGYKGDGFSKWNFCAGQSWNQGKLSFGNPNNNADFLAAHGYNGADVIVDPAKDNVGFTHYYSFAYLSGVVNNYAMFDNFALVPFYKVNYYSDANAETAAYTHQVLFADEEDRGMNKILTSYAPSKSLYAPEAPEGKALLGWSTEKNATVPMATVALANEDIDLYPVFGDAVGYTIAVTAEGNGTVAGAGNYLAYETATLTATAGEGAEFVGWYKGGVKVSDEATYTITVTESAEYVAKFASTGVVPGINMYTGTADVWDFEDGTIPAQITSSAALSVQTFDVEGAPKWMKFTLSDATENKAFYFYYGLSLEADRKYYISHDAKATHPISQYSFFQGGSNAGGVGNIVNNATDTTLGTSYYAGKANTALTAKGTSTSNFFYIQQSGSGEFNFFIDNLALVPYYKVNYYDVDGTTLLETKQVLFADESDKGMDKILTSYVPAEPSKAPTPQDGKVLYGWSTYKDATEAMLSVELENLDINLYPVFGESVEYTVTVNAGKGGTVTGAGQYVINSSATITATPASEKYTFAGWYVDGVKVSDEATYTFTVKGNVTYTAKFKGEGPGINMYTGTADVWDFEDGTIPAAILNAGSIASVHTFDVEGSPKWMKFTTGTEEGSNQAFYFHYGVVMEAGRQYYYTYEARSSHAVTTYLFRQNNVDLTSHYGLVNGASDATLGGLFKGKVSNTVTGNGGESSNFFYIQQSGTGVFDFYIDDIAFVPYYMVTYCDADGNEIETKQVLFADEADKGMDKILTSYAPDLSVAVTAPDGKALYGWSTEKGASVAMETVALENEDITLYPVFGESVEYTVTVNAGKGGTVTGAGQYVINSSATITATPASEKYTFAGWYVDGVKVSDEATYTFTVKGNVTYTAKFKGEGPGINMYTGTADVWDFEDGTIPAQITSSAALSVQTFDVEGAPKWMKFTLSDATANKAFYFYYGLSLEADRKYYISHDAKATHPISQYSFYQGGSNAGGVGNIVNNATDTTLGTSYYAGKANTALTAKGTSSSNFFYIQQAGSGEFNFFIDNLALVPYYMVTYCDADGNEIETKQVLFADEADKGMDKILTSYAPDLSVAVTAPDGKALYGWSTEKGASVAMETVALENEDITLYPVFGDAVEYTITATADGNGSVTGAGAYVINKTVTLTATPASDAYAFEGWYKDGVKVSADATYTFVATENAAYVAKFVGMGPGINLITGKTGAVGFDSAADLGLMEIRVGESDSSKESGYPMNEQVVTPEITAEGNIVIDGALTTGRNIFRFNIPLLKATESDRKYYFNMDAIPNQMYYVDYVLNGNTGDAWPTASRLGMGHQQAVNGEYRKVLETSRASNGSEIELTVLQHQAGSAFQVTFDNFALVPYYKVTYKTAEDVVLEEKQVLFADESIRSMENILTSYTVVDPAELPEAPDGKVLVGWSTEKGATVPMETVALANEDITLYPVFGAPVEYTITVEAEEGGNVTGAGTYVVYETATITATPTGNYVFAGWFKDGVKVSDAPTYSFKVRESATYTAKFMSQGPGINILTGTSAAETFDNEDALSFFRVDDGNLVFSVADGKLLSVNEAGTSHVKYYITIPVVTEEGRNYYFNYDAVANVCEYNSSIEMNYGANAFEGLGGWQQPPYYGQYRFTKTGVGASGIRLWIDQSNFNDQPGTEATDVVGYTRTWDNFAIVPYYMITYYDANGEEIETKQVLFEDEADKGMDKILTSYTPDSTIAVEAPEGKVLAGWSTTEGGEVMKSIPLANEDIDLYPVFKEVSNGIDADDSEVSMKIGTVSGIRFKAGVTSEIRSDETVLEYGFITATEKALGDAELTHEFRKYVSGVAFSRAEGIDKNLGEDDVTGDTIISCVLTGISATNAAHVNTRFVLRPYMVINNGSGENIYVYGASATSSLKEAAQAVKDAAGSDYIDNKSYIDGILALN